MDGKKLISVAGFCTRLRSAPYGLDFLSAAWLLVLWSRVFACLFLHFSFCFAHPLGGLAETQINWSWASAPDKIEGSELCEIGIRTGRKNYGNRKRQIQTSILFGRGRYISFDLKMTSNDKNLKKTSVQSWECCNVVIPFAVKKIGEGETGKSLAFECLTFISRPHNVVIFLK